MNMKSLVVLAGTVVVVCAGASADPTLPLQKPGLWQQTTSQDGQVIAAASSEVCLDTATEQKLAAFSKQMSDKNCQSYHVSHAAEGWVTDSACTLGNGWKTQSHAVVTGDFNSKITTTMDTTTTGAQMAAMNGTHRIVVLASWAGACKPGQKGGDVVMANGMKMNLLNTTSAMQSGGAAPQK